MRLGWLAGIAVVLALGTGTAPAAEPVWPADGLPTVLSFGSQRCPLCIREAKVFDAVEGALSGRVRLEEVLVSEHLDLASEYRVVLIPTLVFLDGEGAEQLRKVGFVDGPRLLGHLRRLGWLGQ